MSDYQLKITQPVDYPRCRIYRQFVQSLIKDRSIRTCGGSGLFYYTVLCSYANFRTSYHRIDGISYTVYPGELSCSYVRSFILTPLLPIHPRHIHAPCTTSLPHIEKINIPPSNRNCSEGCCFCDILTSILIGVCYNIKNGGMRYEELKHQRISKPENANGRSSHQRSKQNFACIGSARL